MVKKRKKISRCKIKCRHPSKKSKDSKIKKLIKLSKLKQRRKPKNSSFRKILSFFKSK